MSRVSRAVREQVRQRANQRCEYCLKPDQYVAQSHQVDHIISQKHHGSDELDNLAWACFQCNLCKGSNIASLDTETGDLVRLFNPRLQVWDTHFVLVLDDAAVVGKTAVGRVTIETLQINHPGQIETRKALIEDDLW